MAKSKPTKTPTNVRLTKAGIEVYVQDGETTTVVASSEEVARKDIAVFLQTACDGKQKATFQTSRGSVVLELGEIARRLSNSLSSRKSKGKKRAEVTPDLSIEATDAEAGESIIKDGRVSLKTAR